MVVWVGSEEENLALIASEPAKFSTTPHYDGHPIVARELITDSWELRT